ncbi:MAG: glycosyltransferase family 2 protein [Candidatus Aenigmarchaeota archaeon]|nr:glycosyltransferase family 2 protein [Candidatus Aenigmarchaeota archaeon]
MKISILIPCYNEEKTIKACIESCFCQTRKPDEIVIVDDGSTDSTPQILKSFGKKIRAVRTPKNTGNKSKAQEFGLKYVTGDVFITADADTLLHCDFVKQIERDFQDKSIAAVAGYVKSLKENWLTSCRELDYIIGQDIHKVAQAHIDALFVMPGCSSAFRTGIFRKYISFDHDTLTEDLDFTYKLHENNLKIKYNQNAISYTQDPATIKAYIRQMKRWYSGGWQNLVKHRKVASKRPGNALELSLIYMEGLTFSLLIFVVPLLSMSFFVNFMASYFVLLFLFAFYGSYIRKRMDILIYFPLYTLLIFLNASLLLMTFTSEVVLKKKNNDWDKLERRKIKCSL